MIKIMEKEKTSFVCQQNEAGRYGCVNSQGKVIIPFKYDYLRVYEELEEVLLEAQKGKKTGIIDLDGKIIIPFDYSYIGIFICEGKVFWDAVNSALDKCGIIDLDGKIIIPFDYDETSIHEENEKVFLIVAKDEKWGVIDLDRKIIIPFDEYEDIIGYDTDEEKVLLIVKKNGKWGVIDLNKKTIIPFEYDAYLEIYKKLLVMKNRKTDFKNHEVLEILEYIKNC